MGAGNGGWTGTRPLRLGKIPVPTRLTEPRDNSLRLVVQEAVVDPGGLIRLHPELPELA